MKNEALICFLSISAWKVFEKYLRVIFRNYYTETLFGGRTLWIPDYSGICRGSVVGKD